MVAQMPRRADEYRSAVAALCRVAASYTDAARFNDAIALLRGLAATLALPDVPAAARAQLYATLTEALRWRGSLVDPASLSEAREAAEHAVAAALQSGEPAVLAQALRARTRAAYQRLMQDEAPDYAALGVEAAEALSWSERADDQAGVISARFLSGLIAERQAQHDVAMPLFEQVLQEATAAGFRREQAEALRHLAFGDMRASRFAAARERFAHALELMRAEQQAFALPFAHLALGEAHDALGESETAHQQYEAGLAIAETTGNFRAQMQLLVDLAEQQVAANNGATARAFLKRALEYAEQLEHRQGLAIIRAQLAKLDSYSF